MFIPQLVSNCNFQCRFDQTASIHTDFYVETYTFNLIIGSCVCIFYVQFSKLNLNLQCTIKRLNRFISHICRWNRLQLSLCIWYNVRLENILLENLCLHFFVSSFLLRIQFADQRNIIHSYINRLVLNCKPSHCQYFQRQIGQTKRNVIARKSITLRSTYHLKLHYYIRIQLQCNCWMCF